MVNGCGVDTASQTVVSDPIPQANISGAPIVLCPNEIVNLIATGGNTYLWSTGETTSSIEVSSGGNYTVTATTGCGSDVANISIGTSNMTVDFITDTLSGAFPLLVNFTNQSLGANTFNWDFGDESGSNLNNPQHTYQSNGTFTVILTGTDIQGCTNTATIKIIVFDDTKITIPNVFTPNSDGNNEYFNIFTNKTNLLISGQIFNRWGGEIATWNSINGGWNGKTDRGTDAEEGVYIYIVNIIFPNGNAVERHGSVSLIR